MSTSNLSAYPASCPTKLIRPGSIRLASIRWHHAGGIVTGYIGPDDFTIDLPTADILDRRKFVFACWRYHHLLGIMPGICEWQDAIAAAEVKSK